MNFKRSSIIVNDVAASYGGALSILKQFLDELKVNPKAKDYNWIVFVSNNLVNEYNSDHIKIKKVNTKAWLKRMWWDTFGIKKWLKRNEIEPKLAISLMSVGFKFLDIPQIVYIHQPLPYGDFNYFKWFEWKLHFYTWGIFKWMKWSIKKNSIIVVQTDWLKNAVQKKLGIKNIHVIRPDAKVYEYNEKCQKKSLSGDLFYPATPDGSYKNHELLIHMLYELKKENYELGNKIKLIFTFKPNTDKLTKYYYKLAVKLGVSTNIKWIGFLNKDQMLQNYLNCDAVVFPSKIESFGLPLIESASIGKKIFVLDKPYAKDVLKGYNGYEIIEDDPVLWAKKIVEFYSSEQLVSFDKLTTFQGEWDKMIDLIIEKSKTVHIS
ncbi:MAG: glycosyltransferase [Candidatus Micrarchaeaceae archaeon]